jgi:hypothetical protein
VDGGTVAPLGVFDSRVCVDGGALSKGTVFVSADPSLLAFGDDPDDCVVEALVDFVVLPHDSRGIRVAAIPKANSKCVRFIDGSTLLETPGFQIRRNYADNPRSQLG